MKHKIFIDGREGTAGLQLYERLAARDDLELLLPGDGLRRDAGERRRLINSAEIVFLCLPDDAARESVSMIESPDVRVIDASTAHRTAEGWVYGFPELSQAQREAIAGADRVANPGCHASGFISLVYPLRCAGLLRADAPLTCFSLTGYSGGGRKMIAQYEAPERPAELDSPRIYGLTLEHKHLPEMAKLCDLERAPAFSPIVAPYYKGMATSVTLFPEFFTERVTPEYLREVYAAVYGGSRFISVETEPTAGMLAGNRVLDTNDMIISVNGSPERMIVTSQFDNLGKGASGAAVQNMNIMLGLPEDTGLI